MAALTYTLKLGLHLLLPINTPMHDERKKMAAAEYGLLMSQVKHPIFILGLPLVTLRGPTTTIQGAHGSPLEA